ncbi:MAG: hypothetical protein HYZ24_01535 [Chloroflexi bacterium]|nr:hypothetical protein [Chloroflexota bacterium]
MPKPKNQRMDKAIVIALIGLAGTVITGLLSSPILKALIEKTPVPATATSVGGGETLVFENDFEDGESTGFSFSSEEWQVKKEKGNYALEVSGTGNNTTLVWFGPNDFSDGSIEFRILFKNFDGFLLNFRSTIDAETYTMYFAPESREVKLGYGSVAHGWELESFQSGLQSHDFSENTWYDVKLEAAGESITLWISGNKILSTFDSRLRKGSMEFAVQYDGTILLDDVKVWELGQ